MNDNNETTDTRPDYEVARDELRALVASLGLKVTVSEARGGVDEPQTKDGDAWPHLAYTLTFPSNGGTTSFPYRMGVGCIPWDRVSINKSTGSAIVGGKLLPSHVSRFVEQFKRKQSVRFTNAKEWAEACAVVANALGFQPDVAEVLGCIARDGDALAVTFEDWASEYGYDTDSRKAEATYRACIDGVQRLRRFVNPETIAKLSELSARL